MKAYKIVKDDYTDYYTGKTRYVVGEKLVHPDPDRSSDICSRGYHVSDQPWLAAKYNRIGRLLLVEVEAKNILAKDVDKMRVSELTVIKELNKYEIYGPNWKKVLKKIERASNKDAYYKATAPCPKRMMNEVIRRFAPFTKKKLKAETKPFDNWATARA